MRSDDVVVLLEALMSDAEPLEELENYRRAARRGRLRALIAPLAVLPFLGVCVGIWVGIGAVMAYTALAQQGHEQISVWPAGAFTYTFRSETADGSCGGRIEVRLSSSRTSATCVSPDGRIKGFTTL
jgi:hypothetical protein